MSRRSKSPDDPIEPTGSAPHPSDKALKAEFTAEAVRYMVGTIMHCYALKNVEKKDRDDILQEVLAALWARWSLLRTLDHKRQKAYLYQVVNKRVARYMSTSIRERKQTQAWANWQRFEEERRWAIENPDDWNFDLYHPYLWEATLWDAVATLSERQQAALLMHYLGGFSVNEIAQRLGTSAGTVKTHLSRAREQLAKRLAAKEDSGGS
jgi:RNA polymerase sigma-70 factor (ECF subfamily)